MQLSQGICLGIQENKVFSCLIAYAQVSKLWQAYLPDSIGTTLSLFHKIKHINLDDKILKFDNKLF